jgi:D-galactarolactone isomerase
MKPSSWAEACDCHVHVYAPGYPLAPTATFQPPIAPVSAYRGVQQALGTGRVVVVQPTGYGFDNRCTLAAVAELGQGARGVAVVPPDLAEADLRQLHAAGIRGVRYMMLPGGVLPWDGLEQAAARIAPLGWNINLQLDGRTLPQHEEVLRRLPCNLVIDHVAKFLGPVTPQDPAFASLRRLLDGGRCWIKLSAPYESSRSGGPAYADVAAFVRELAAGYPERGLWASNWPHPNVVPTPSDAALLEWALPLFGDQAAQRRILVDNPAEVYGF